MSLSKTRESYQGDDVGACVWFLCSYCGWPLYLRTLSEWWCLFLQRWYFFMCLYIRIYWSYVHNHRYSYVRVLTCLKSSLFHAVHEAIFDAADHQTTHGDTSAKLGHMCAQLGCAHSRIKKPVSIAFTEWPLQCTADAVKALLVKSLLNLKWMEVQMRNNVLLSCCLQLTPSIVKL